MNASPTEEAGKALAGVTHALKEQPLALALIVLNVLWLAAVVFLSHANNVREDQLIADLVKACAALRQ